jgi:hypothetical protein
VIVIPFTSEVVSSIYDIPLKRGGKQESEITPMSNERKARAAINGQSVLIQLIGFRGGHFTGHRARPDPGYGPGWYVFGANPAYASRYTMRTAQPDVKPRKHPHYNCLVQLGWSTRREAQAVADHMNVRDRGCIGMVASLGALHGTVFNA